MFKVSILYFTQVFTLLVTFFATIFVGVSPYTPYTVMSPLPTPVYIEMKSVIGKQLVTFYVDKYPTKEEAYEAFLSSYEGTQLSGFIQYEKLKGLGYFGYHSWYPDTLSIHTTVYTGTYVLRFDNTNTEMIYSDFLRNHILTW